MDDLCEPIWGHWQGALLGSTSRLCCNPSAREHEGAGSGRWVCQADTGGHLFAISAMLGFRFAPRIRNLTDRRLYAFTPAATCPELVR